MLAKFHLIYNLLLIIFTNERFCSCKSSVPNKYESKTPSQLVEDIVRKVCNMTVHTLAASSNIEKDKLISKIENKLHKSAKALQYDDNYVKLIMKGIRLIAYNHTRKNDETTENIEIVNEPNKPSKKQLVSNIAHKVEYIAKAYSKSKKSGDRNKIVTDIQKVIEKAANKKHKELHDNHNVMKTYNNIISQGIAQAMEKIKEARRMELEFVQKKLPHDDEHSDMLIFKRKSNINKEAVQHSAPRPGDHINDLRALSCHEMKKHVCLDIKLLNVLECPADNTELSIEKLCDGMMDCSDSSDERNCTRRVLDIVRNASGLMTQIEFAISGQCYPPIVENTVMSKENEILKEVLRTQVKFIEKHSMDNYSPVSDIRNFSINNMDKARSAANEVVVVIHTLSLALRSVLCLDHTLMNSNKTQQSQNFVTISRTNATSEENAISEDKPLVKGKLSSCACNGQFCLRSNCLEECASVCRHKYSLGRWKCDSVTEGKSVSLDEICDGKLDCFDESDESDCFEGSSVSKFEANKMYELIIETILKKIKTERIEPIRRLLINLINSVRRLTSLTAKRNPDKLEIKSVRDQSFAEMVLIYEAHLVVSKSMVEMQKNYGYLMHLNDKLISAVKRSHTGNERIITADGCYCANNKCSLPRCSKICIRACVAEPILTRYYCGGSNSYEDSIPPSAVCNDKNDCINKDDEEGCKKDTICRKHHLVLLRHTIKSIGEHRNVRGTSVGEALNSWKTKVTATLRIAESEDEDRPTPKIMRDIVKSMLRDLLMTYAGMEEGKKNNDLVLEQFYNVSHIVVDSLRSCGK